MTTDDERRKAIEQIPDEDTVIKFTDGGSMTVNFRQEAEAQEAAWEAFQNSPTGKGLLAQFADAWGEDDDDDDDDEAPVDLFNLDEGCPDCGQVLGAVDGVPTCDNCGWQP